MLNDQPEASVVTITRWRVSFTVLCLPNLREGAPRRHKRDARLFGEQMPSRVYEQFVEGRCVPRSAAVRATMRSWTS